MKTFQFRLGEREKERSNVHLGRQKGTLICYQMVVTWMCLSLNPFSVLTRTDQGPFRESRDKSKRYKNRLHYGASWEGIMGEGREGASLLLLTSSKTRGRNDLSVLQRLSFPSVPSTLFPPSFLLHLLSANFIALLDPLCVKSIQLTFFK